MRVRIQDENGDYTFGSGQSNFFLNSVEGVAQAVQTRLLLWTGEWFLNVDEGTPYLQGVIGKQDQQTIDNVLRARILGTEGVSSILSYESIIDRENRKLNVSVSISTIYGETTIKTVV